MPESFLYRAKRHLASVFTKRCLSCGKVCSGNLCICHGCAEKLVPIGIFFENGISAVSAYAYTGSAKDVMLHFKFTDGYEICIDTLSDWLCEAFDKHLASKSFDFVISVPSFGARPRTELFVKDFSHRRGLKFHPEYLTKIRKTKKQHKLSAMERRTNLIGAFSASSKVYGKRILLVDDIFTTGNTVSECSKALIDAGAKEVCVLTVLKSVLS